MSETQDTRYERTFKIPDAIYHDNKRWWDWYNPTVKAVVDEAVESGVEPDTVTVSLLDEDGEPMPAGLEGEPAFLSVRVSSVNGAS